MKVRHHIALSAVAAAILFRATRSPRSGVACFAAGVGIDIDHVLEYLREHGCNPNIDNFFDTFTRDRYRKAVLAMHAWEWLVFLGLLQKFTKNNPWILGAAAGLALHLVADQCANKPRRLGYSIVFRALRAFDYRKNFIRPPLEKQ